MSKILTAEKVKRLPVGTDVITVCEKDGSRGMMWIVKSGRKKMLRGVLGMTHDIRDRDGWHYEVTE